MQYGYIPALVFLLNMGIYLDSSLIQLVYIRTRTIYIRIRTIFVTVFQYICTTVECQIIVPFGTLIDRFIPSRRGSKVFLFGLTPKYILYIHTVYIYRGIYILVYIYRYIYNDGTWYIYVYRVYISRYIYRRTGIYLGIYMTIVHGIYISISGIYISVYIWQ